MAERAARSSVRPLAMAYLGEVRVQSLYLPEHLIQIIMKDGMPVPVKSVFCYLLFNTYLEAETQARSLDAVLRSSSILAHLTVELGEAGRHLQPACVCLVRFAEGLGDEDACA